MLLHVVGIRHVEVSRCDALREAVMHTILAPPLQHVDDFFGVDLVARIDFALIDLV